MLNSYSENSSLIGSLTVLRWIKKKVIEFLQTKNMFYILNSFNSKPLLLKWCSYG